MALAKKYECRHPSSEAMSEALREALHETSMPRGTDPVGGPRSAEATGGGLFDEGSDPASEFPDDDTTDVTVRSSPPVPTT